MSKCWDELLSHLPYLNVNIDARTTRNPRYGRFFAQITLKQPNWEAYKPIALYI